MSMRIVWIVVEIIFAFGMAYVATDTAQIKRHSGAGAYVMCGLSVFAFAVFLGGAADLPCAERNQLSESVFLVMIIPALLGVRFALLARYRHALVDCSSNAGISQPRLIAEACASKDNAARTNRPSSKSVRSDVNKRNRLHPNQSREALDQR